MGPATKYKGVDPASQQYGRGPRVVRSGGWVPQSAGTGISTNGGTNTPSGRTATSRRSGGK